MRIFNFVHPHLTNKITVVNGRSDTRIKVRKTPTTYQAQLTAFADAVLRDQAFPTGVEDSIATMRLIDACYRAAGLPVRQPTPGPWGGLPGQRRSRNRCSSA